VADQKIFKHPESWETDIRGFVIFRFCHSRMFTRLIHTGTSLSGIKGWRLEGGSPTDTFGDDSIFKDLEGLRNLRGLGDRLIVLIYGSEYLTGQLFLPFQTPERFPGVNTHFKIRIMHSFLQSSYNILSAIILKSYDRCSPQSFVPLFQSID